MLSMLQFALHDIALMMSRKELTQIKEEVPQMQGLFGNLINQHRQLPQETRGSTESHVGAVEWYEQRYRQIQADSGTSGGDRGGCEGTSCLD